MTLSCEQVRTKIVDGDESAELRAHVDGCAECRAVFAALEEVDVRLGELAPIDAPEALVEKTLSVVREDDTAAAAIPFPVSPPAREEKAREDVEAPSLLVASMAMLASALGALVVAPLLLVRWLLGIGTPPKPTPPARSVSRDPAPRRFGLAPMLAMASLLVVVALTTWRTLGSTVKMKVRGADGVIQGLPTIDSSGSMGPEASASADEWRNAESPAPVAAATAPAPAPSFGAGLGGQHALDLAGDELTELEIDNGRWADAPGYDATEGYLGPTTGEGERDGDGTVDAPAAAATDQGIFWNHEADRGERAQGASGATATLLLPGASETTTDREELRAELAAVPAQGVRRGLEEHLDRVGGLDEPTEVDGRFGRDEEQAEARRLTLQERVPVTDVPAAWIAAHATTGLAFAPSEGWWANTYVPGDARLRMLHTRLAASTTPLAGAASALALAESASPTTPAVAAPTDRAIAIGVHADTAAIEGPTRVRVEVALRAIEQAVGRRGALRIALVVDATAGLGEPETDHLRSLLAALSRSLTPRDRVVLTAAGPAGGTLVPLGVLRHGQVEVALRHLASAHDVTGEQVPVSLSDALAAGLEAVSDEDDGAGLALLVTPNGAHDAAVDQALHLGAVAGVSTTAIGIGTGASTASLDDIALVGEGRRRLVLGDDDAGRVVREELVQASRLVARALRVRLHLAEGVQLVDVVGSHALDQDETRRTRESERAIDLSLARRLGIGQDRDDDDSGVRILVPSFYAGDSHTIVLDLLVSRPGPVLDVDVRFKDLVRLGNGTASSALALEAGTAPRGPHELRVIASWLGHDVAAALEGAAADVDRGDVAAARGRLTSARALLDQARGEVPGLASIVSTTTDRQLLDRFVVALDVGTDRPIVAASLHYAAARRQLVPQLQASTP